MIILRIVKRMEEVMTVLVAHYSDDWQSESEGTKVFANTAAGAVAAINWIDGSLPFRND